MAAGVCSRTTIVFQTKTRPSGSTTAGSPHTTLVDTDALITSLAWFVIHHLIAAFRGRNATNLLYYSHFHPFSTFVYTYALTQGKGSSETAATYVKHSFKFFFFTFDLIAGRGPEPPQPPNLTTSVRRSRQREGGFGV